ncbi:hypothetical protein EDB85DRAFT_1458217 [Lactarius pseudohatsudake]|nr:hypothetical protein EDB85DRAFT_1458217 [Lactarius pseudohatsudake]
MSNFSTLDHSPSAETFVAGMELGTSVDGISGDMPPSAIDPATITSERVPDQKTGTQYSLRLIENLRELKVREAFKNNGSITFAGGDVEASVNKAFDFSHSRASTGYSILVVLHCEKRGPSMRIGKGAKLTEGAKALVNNPQVFRERYGDYYVHEISREARFTVVWKCSSQSESTLVNFKNSISGNVGVDTQASGKLEARLNVAAKESNVSMEVQYNVLGDMGSTHIDVNAGVTEYLDLFNANCIPVPSSVLLRHYSYIEPSLPTSISMDPDLYVRTRKAFDDIRLAVLLNGTLPGDESSRISGRHKIEELFQEIHSKRSNYSKGSQDLSGALNQLAGLLEGLYQILTRHELITSLRNISYDEAIREHLIENTDDTAAWIPSQQNKRTFSVGRTNPSAEDIKKYGIEHISQGPGMESNQKYVALKRVSGSLGFPGGTGVHGTVIGFTVNDHWGDATNGWWGIVPKTNPLGRKDLKVSVKSQFSKGLHWSLDVWYIPTHLYNA